MLKDILQASRLYGAHMMVVVVLVGAFIGGFKGDIPVLFFLILIATLSDAAMGLTNELYDHGEDYKEPTGQHPLCKMELNLKRRLRFILLPFLLCSTIFISLFIFGLFSTIILVAAGALETYYSAYGKYQKIMYDITPALAFSLLVFFGSFATTGSINTAVIIVALGAFILELMTQWAGGMIGVEYDRDFNVKSPALLSGYREEDRIKISTWNGFYYILLTIIFCFTLLLPVIFNLVSTRYFLFFIFYIVPLQIIGIDILYTKKHNSLWLKRYFYFFFFLCSIIPIVFVWCYRGLTPAAIIFGYAFGWVVLIRLVKVKF